MTKGDKYYPNVRTSLKYSLCGPSVYGEADPVTLRQLSGLKGRVLELGAGDGRYTTALLKQADVFASDIYPEELRILRRRNLFATLSNLGEVVDDGIANIGRASRKLRETQSHQLQTGIVNAFEPLPFEDKSFDAVVTTGFMYLYPEEHIRRVFVEAHRVLKKNGTLVFDFITDRHRIRQDGSEIFGESEIRYTKDEGLETIKSVLSGLFGKVDIQISHIDEDLNETAGFHMKATKLNVKAKKI